VRGLARECAPQRSDARLEDDADDLVATAERADGGAALLGQRDLERVLVRQRIDG
jgi:hypothetical protein